MFRKETVLVLGAGASWHYGYPTGEQLVQDIIKVAGSLNDYCELRAQAVVHADRMPDFVQRQRPKSATEKWRAAGDHCRDFVNRLENVAPLVIDYFLGWNQQHHDLGRMMIAAALMRREKMGAGRVNANRWLSDSNGVLLHSFPFNSYKDDWIRFVVHQLLLECRSSEDILLNKFSVVTFNYDRSFELRLAKSLNAIDFIKSEHVSQFMRGRVVHMYGSLLPEGRDHDSLAMERIERQLIARPENIKIINDTIDAWEIAGAGLKVIDPHTKSSGLEGDQARAMLRNSENQYFLGFGFDQGNLVRLDLPRHYGNGRQDHVFLTNYQNSQTINKRVARAFQVSAFENPAEWRGINQNFVVERSVRDAYQALELDFGGLSE